jgi:hypothetical protein
MLRFSVPAKRGVIYSRMTKDQRPTADDITEAEWKIIEARANRRDLATEQEVEALFRRYRDTMREKGRGSG